MKVILKETLEKQGKSQYWLAKETGIAQSTLSNLCANKLIFLCCKKSVMLLIVILQT